MLRKKLISAILAIALAAALLPLASPTALAAGDTFTTVSAGGRHSLAIKADGSLWYWGVDYLYQYGVSSTVPFSALPVKVLDNAESASAGGGHSLAIKTDGSLWAWGLNDSGQLGDGTTTNRPDPVKIMDEVTFVSAGSSHSLAIKTDGSLWAWGSNAYGQLGDGTGGERDALSTAPVEIMDDIAVAAAGNYHTLAIKTDGSLWAWGMNSYGQIGDGTGGSDENYYPYFRNTPIKIMDGATSVSAGGSYSMAIKTDGSLWAWGGLNYNYLGGETSIITEQYTPVQIMDGVASVSAGSNFTTVIKTDGSLWAWGYGPRGQIGAGGDVQSVYTPLRILSGVASVSSGGSHSLAIKTDGSLWAWGDNRSGQVGDMWREHCFSPTQVFAYDISVYLDGRLLSFDVPPYLINGRTLVPLRVIFDELGASIVWDNLTKTVTATKGDTVVVLTVGDSSPTVNGQVVPIDQPMIAVSGRTLVPLRFVAEAFGVKVDWNPATWTVTITS